MGFAIIEVVGKDAKDLAGWDWADLLDEPADRIFVDTFDNAKDLQDAVTSKTA